MRKAFSVQKGWLLPALLLFPVWLLSQGIATRNVTPSARPKFSGKPWLSKFTDTSEKAGFRTPTTYGAEGAVDYLVESSGGGVAVFDYDRDGWLDVFIVNGTRFAGSPSSHHMLYHNNHDGTFTDVSTKAGVAVTGWGMGAAVGDYDGDGFDDLFVTQWGTSLLFRNRGDGTFEQKTISLPPGTWASGATFVDYDRDGDLDLFVASYMQFDPAKTPKPGANPNCVFQGMAVACGPRGLPTGRVFLFRNDKGKFIEAPLPKAPRTYAMTAVAADFDDDGWPDIYVASDSTPSLYFRNQHNGTFAEEALERGVAVNEDGREQAGMGIAMGDFNGDGRLDIFKTHFSDDTPVLYRNDGSGQFTDVTLPSGLGVETRYVGWGDAMADFDNDGWPDIFWVTGHVYPERKDYKGPFLLFRNLGTAKFEQIDIPGLHSSRGAIAADFDNDGDLDVLIWNRNEPPTFLRNDTPGTNHWIQFEAPIHTRVTITLSSGKTFTQEVLSQSSFYSAPGRVLHFGTGRDTAVDVKIRLPDGKTLTARKTCGARLSVPADFSPR